MNFTRNKNQNIKEKIYKEINKVDQNVDIITKANDINKLKNECEKEKINLTNFILDKIEKLKIHRPNFNSIRELLDNNHNYFSKEEYKDVKSDIDLIENLYNFLNKENNKISEDIHEKIDLIANNESYELRNIKNDINELKNLISTPILN